MHGPGGPWHRSNLCLARASGTLEAWVHVSQWLTLLVWARSNARVLTFDAPASTRFSSSDKSVYKKMWMQGLWSMFACAFWMLYELSRFWLSACMDLLMSSRCIFKKPFGSSCRSFDGRLYMPIGRLAHGLNLCSRGSWTYTFADLRLALARTFRNVLLVRPFGYGTHFSWHVLGETRSLL